MSRDLLKYGLWFVVLFLLQVLLFREVERQAEWAYVQFFIYPLFILWLPLRVHEALVIFLGFLMGLLVDLVYNSPGVHASALTAMAFLRPFVLNWLQPREGYNVNMSPTLWQYGMSWFLKYVSALLFLHILVYNISSFFTFYYWKDILLHTLWSFVASLTCIVIFNLPFSSRR